MIRFIILFLSLFYVFTGAAQVGSFNQLNAKELTIGERFYLPVVDTTYIPKRNGAVVLRPADNIIYKYVAVMSGPNWTPIIGLAGVSTWGSITGTLSDQTDLQNALNAKVDTARTLTINGVTYSLASNRAWSLDLQSVSDVGNLSTNSLRSTNGFYLRNSTNTSSIGYWINNGNVTSELYIPNTSTGRAAMLANNLLEFKATGSNYQVIKPFASPSAAYVSFTLPDASSDRTIPISVTLNGSTTYANTTTGDIDLGTVSSATVLNNVGTGFDLAQELTDNVKRLAMGYGVIIDSTSTANTVTVGLDTSLISTKDNVNHVADSIAALISADGTTYGTYAQRVALTGSVQPGHRFYQTNERKGNWEYNGTEWEHAPAFRSIYYNFLFGNVFGSVYQQNWTTSGAGTSISMAVSYPPTNSSSAPNDYRSYQIMASGTAAGAFVGINGGNGSTFATHADSNWHTIFVNHNAPLIAPNGTNDYQILFGMAGSTMGQTGTDPTAGAYFRLKNSSPSGNIECVTRNAGVETTTNSGVSIASADSAIHEYVIDLSSARVLFYIDGTLVANVTTNIPTTSITAHTISSKWIAGTGGTLYINRQYTYQIRKN